MELTRDEQGWLVPQEPMYLSYSERDTVGAKLYGPQYPQPDLWECREHPDWQGEDWPESRIAEMEARGDLADAPGGPRGQWERESIQVHAHLHGFTVTDRHG